MSGAGNAPETYSRSFLMILAGPYTESPHESLETEIFKINLKAFPLRVNNVVLGCTCEDGERWLFGNLL